MLECTGQKPLHHVSFDGPGAIFSAGVLFSNFDQTLYCPFFPIRQALNILYTPKVGEVHVIRGLLHHPVDGCDQGFRVKLNGRSRGKNESPVFSVELTVGNAESITGKPTPCLLIPNAEMVPGVTGRIHERQGPAAYHQAVAIFHCQHPLRAYWLERSVHRIECLIAIHTTGAGLESGGIGHMTRTVRMDHKLCIRHSGYQLPCTSRMVEMNMSDDDMAHFLWPSASALKNP